MQRDCSKAFMVATFLMNSWEAFPGKPARREFSYIRHGVLSLIAFLDLIIGKARLPYPNKTSTEENFVKAIRQMIASNPNKDIYFSQEII